MDMKVMAELETAREKEQPKRRFPKGELLVRCKDMIYYFGDSGYEHCVCGSYRRQKPTCADLDILVKCESLYWFEEPPFCDIRWRGDKKISFIYNEVPVDIKAVPEESWGAGLLHHTGNNLFNIYLRSQAKKKGLKLNEYGLFWRENNERLNITTEYDILAHVLGRTKADKYINPANREFKDWRKK